VDIPKLWLDQIFLTPDISDLLPVDGFGFTEEYISGRI
jgi:hypothetical protein